MRALLCSDRQGPARCKADNCNRRSLIHTSRTGQIASHALFDVANPMSLRPKTAEIRVDRKYILAAMGLLSAHHPKIALQIMKEELEKDGFEK